jgi:hypothetical protein
MYALLRGQLMLADQRALKSAMHIQGDWLRIYRLEGRHPRKPSMSDRGYAATREQAKILSYPQERRPITPSLGCAAYPRRASEARLRRRPVDSLEVHGTEARSTVANMEDLPAQPR